MSKHYSHKTLVGVSFTIFDPGQTISENWLEEIEPCLWYLPRECQTVWDCVNLDNERLVHVIGDGECHTVTERDYRFTKWAVYLTFSYMEESGSNNFHETKTAMQYQVFNTDEEYVFRDAVEDLIALADPVLFRVATRDCQWDQPRYGVSIVTLWEYCSFTTGWEVEEWDSSWELLGRVDMVAVIAENGGGE